MVPLWTFLISWSFLTGKPLPADQDPGGLLLLCVRAAGGQGRPRPLLCGDGPGHDRGHLVSRPGWTEHHGFICDFGAAACSSRTVFRIHYLMDERMNSRRSFCHISWELSTSSGSGNKMTLFKRTFLLYVRKRAVRLIVTVNNGKRLLLPKGDDCSSTLPRLLIHSSIFPFSLATDVVRMGICMGPDPNFRFIILNPSAVANRT